jgi:hypothetical protein
MMATTGWAKATYPCLYYLTLQTNGATKAEASPPIERGDYIFLP